MMTWRSHREIEIQPALTGLVLSLHSTQDRKKARSLDRTLQKSTTIVEELVGRSIEKCEQLAAEYLKVIESKTDSSNNKYERPQTYPP